MIHWPNPRASLLIVAVLVLGNGVAATAGSEAPEEVRLLFREANRLYRAGDYQGALQHYLRVQELHANYKVELNLASTFLALEQRPQAAAHYERFLQRGEGKAPQTMSQHAQQELGKLRAQLGRVVINCSVAGAAIAIDGRRVGETPLGRPLYVVPGVHQLTVTQAGYLPFDETVDIAAGKERQRIVTLHEPPAPAATAAAAAAVSVTAAALPDAEPQAVATDPRPGLVLETAADADRRRTKTIWAYATLGTGLSLAAAAGVLYGIGFSNGSAAYDRYRDATDPEEIDRHRSDVESASDLIIIGHILLGVGVATLGLSLYHFFTRPPEPASTAWPHGIQLAPIVSRQGTGLTMKGAF